MYGRGFDCGKWVSGYVHTDGWSGGKKKERKKERRGFYLMYATEHAVR